MMFKQHLRFCCCCCFFNFGRVHLLYQSGCKIQHNDNFNDDDMIRTLPWTWSPQRRAWAIKLREQQETFFFWYVDDGVCSNVHAYNMCDLAYVCMYVCTVNLLEIGVEWWLCRQYLLCLCLCLFVDSIGCAALRLNCLAIFHIGQFQGCSIARHIVIGETSSTHKLRTLASTPHHPKTTTR